MPHILRLTIDLYEFDTKKILVYVKNGRDDERNREVLFDEGGIQAQVVFNIEAAIISSSRPRYETNAAWRIDVPGVPNVKVLVDWQAMLRVIFIFKRDNGLKLFLPDGIKISS